MDQEIKHPVLDKPNFIREPYDYRNYECAGEFRGVGEAGKVGARMSSSIEAMPPKKKDIWVPRDHKG